MKKDFSFYCFNRQITILALTILVICSAIFPAFAQDEVLSHASDEITLKIFHTNDTHANLNSFTATNANGSTEEVGGAARLITFVNNARAENKNMLLLSSGDAFQGTLFFNFFKGIVDLKCMSAARYDAMCPGNHEFDDGIAWMLEALNTVNFPIVNCNVKFDHKIYPAAKKQIKPYIIKNINGLRIAIIGSITKDLFTVVDPKNLVGSELIMPVEALKPILRKLRPRVDMIILLSHMGLKEDLESAEILPEIDLIIGGHSHSKCDNPIIVKSSTNKEVIVSQAGEKGEFVGEVTMSYSKSNRKWRLAGGKLNRLDSKIPKNAEIQKLIDGYDAQIAEQVQVVIGNTVRALIGSRELVRTVETNLGDMIADILMMNAKTDIGIINGGSIRTGIEKGDIKIADCINVFPFNSVVTKVTMKGSILRAAFRLVAQKIADPAKYAKLVKFGGFLQVSKGMRVAYKNGEVTELSLNGKSINDYELYTVAMSDFTASGGDGFSMFAEVSDKVSSGVKIMDIIIDYVKQTKIIDVDIEGRIK
ncbi:MAG: bifunctional UDP-sugar hydrolase/5'-nucleotidase [Candidatus Wallbacteria bacterium]